jgi:hypothetical protein
MMVRKMRICQDMTSDFLLFQLTYYGILVKI